jgi:hypothetical protein
MLSFWVKFSLSNFPLLALLVKKEKKNQSIKINKFKVHLKYNDKNPLPPILKPISRSQL